MNGDQTAQQLLLRGLALQWEMRANAMKSGPAAGTRTCAADLYEIVGVPPERDDECCCGRLRFQHGPGEVCP